MPVNLLVNRHVCHRRLGAEDTPDDGKEIFQNHPKANQAFYNATFAREGIATMPIQRR